MKLFGIIRKHGLKNSASIALKRLMAGVTFRYDRWRLRKAPEFNNPTPSELSQIEKALLELGFKVHDHNPPPTEFKRWQSEKWFPEDYHGGIDGPVWDEKLLEHWLTFKLLGLRENKTYVDIAAGGSPWAKILRERLKVDAFAVDLELSPDFSGLPYYREGDATRTAWGDDSIDAASLQCAYEMFTKDDDVLLIDELARILKPGGKAVILPLYMHTHYCAYSTPDCFGKGFSDPKAKEYICWGHNGIPSSRKYDAETLKTRILSRIHAVGLDYRLLALRSKEEYGKGIYCHFILEIIKPVT